MISYLYYFFIALGFILPIIAVISVIVLSVRKTPFFWLKPVYSAFDSLNEIFAWVALFLFNFLAWKTFIFFTRGYSSGPSSPIELMFLGTIAISLAYSFWVKSYSATVFFIFAAFCFVVGETIHWGVNRSFFIDNSNSYVSPLVLASFSWLVLNTLYPLAQYIKQFKQYARAGNLLRFVIITINAIFLAFLSNNYVANYSQYAVNGSNMFVSWPLILLFAAFVCVFAFLLFILKNKPVFHVVKWEALASISPISILFIMANISTLQLSEYSYSYSQNYSAFSIGWLISFNVLFFLYLVYLVIKSAKTKEAWLKVYSVILLVLAVMYKFFDYWASFTFQGIFFIVFGLLLVAAVFAVHKFSKKLSSN